MYGNDCGSALESRRYQALPPDTAPLGIANQLPLAAVFPLVHIQLLEQGQIRNQKRP